MLLRFAEESLFAKSACDTILYCLANNAMASEAAEFLRDAWLKGYLPDSSTFNIVMTCLIKELDLDETCGIFERFTKQGVKPSFST